MSHTHSQAQLTASPEPARANQQPEPRASQPEPRASQSKPAARASHNRIGKEGTAQVNYVEYVVVCVEKK